ncbi:MAG: hypothetical protein COB13_011640 [OCS116 cluster bacterium]|nr:hypothetical protein [OCS116 cluster bacterium]
MKKILAILILSMTITSCAQKAEHVQASYISTTRYDGWKCSKLRKEYMFVEEALIRSSKTQDDAASTDVVMVILIGLPTSGGGIKNEIASLKGQREALRQSARDAGCRSLNISKKV